MYDIHKEIKLEKLRENKNRQNYLKLLAISSLIIDFITYLSAETIELAFTDLHKHFSVLIGVFLIIGLVITISLFLNKIKTLLIFSLIYLFTGLALFFYLIIQEMQTNSGGMQPIDSGKPEIYFKVFIYIIITLNIVSAIFRSLGSLFMLIFLRIAYKINKLTEELSDYMKDGFLINDKITTRSPTFLSNTQSVGRKLNEDSTAGSDFRYRDYLKKNFQTFVDFRDQKKKFGYDSVIRKGNPNEGDTRSEISDRQTNEMGMFVNKNKYNQIHVHIHNYNIYRNSRKNSTPPDYLIESTEKENMGNLYETPRGSICDNNFNGGKN